MLVTTVTKTNEAWSLPLRSSQSIEHGQQIKYWSCLLGSTFFYSETPFHLCLTAVHTYTRMKQEDMWKCALEEPRMGTARHPPCRGSLSMLSNYQRKEEWIPHRNYRTWAQLLRITLRDLSEKQEQNLWHIVPSGCACTNRRNSSKATRWAPLAKLQRELEELKQIPRFNLTL